MIMDLEKMLLSDLSAKSQFDRIYFNTAISNLVSFVAFSTIKRGGWKYFIRSLHR